MNFIVPAFNVHCPARAVLGLFSLAWVLGQQPGVQAQVSACQPPASDEYLLLVATPTADDRQFVRSVLPSGTVGICRYQNDTVARVGGFRRVQDAERWGRYVSTLTRLRAAVVEPPGAATAAGEVRPVVPYNPQVLGEGYAVLIDYFNQPQLAAQVRQITGRDVGLVSYFSRPYLLALYTRDRNTANAALRQLSDRGLSASIVDSRRAILLTPAVNY